MDASEQRARELWASQLRAKGMAVEAVGVTYGPWDQKEDAALRAIMAALAQQVPADGECERLEFLNGIDPDSGFYLDNYWLGLVRNDDGSVTLRNARGTPLAAIAATPQAPKPVVDEDGAFEDDRITRADLAGTMAELVDQYDPAERAPLTDEEKAVLIDFLHGMVDTPLFLGVAGHYFAQNPVAGSTASQPQQGAVAIQQFRYGDSTFWYDGVPSPEYGPAETRTLYTTIGQQAVDDATFKLTVKDGDWTGTLEEWRARPRNLSKPLRWWATPLTAHGKGNADET